MGGTIGNVSVLQGGINGLVLGGSTSTMATSIGNITANLSIEGTSAIASGAIGNVTSIAGFIGGSSNTATFIKPGIVVTVNLGGTFNINGVVAVQGGQPGPKADVFIGGSVGNIYALGDISGNVITATAGNVGNITSHEGRIAFDAVSASGNIGNIYANSQDATFAFDSAGNVLETTAAISGAALTGYSLVPSASAIDHSSFTAGGTIGTITARASAVGGYFPAGAGNAPVYMHNRAIDTSDFIAGTQIGNVYAVDASTVYHAAYTGTGDAAKLTYATGLNAAIFESNFIVTATAGGVGIGNVKAIANGGPGIYYSTFHAVSGNIGNVYGRSVLNNGIFSTSIEADSGNVGIVKGVTLGGDGTTHSDALEHVIITAGAGPGGTGTIAGIYGRSAQDNGIDHLKASSGTGGITYITGISNGGIGEYYGHYSDNGIVHSNAVTTGPVGNVTGTSSGGSGIEYSYFAAKSFGNITGTTSGYGSGIRRSTFDAMHGIGNISGSATTHVGAYGIEGSHFNANTVGDGSGAIGTVTGTTAGHASGIGYSYFYAGSGIGNILGTATNVYGNDGIFHSKFGADSALLGTGTIGTITGTTIGKGGSGIAVSSFYSGAGIGNIYGGALGAYSANGIVGSHFNGDDAQKFTSAIGTITGVSKNLAGNIAGSGINGSFFTAGAKISNVLGTSTDPASASYGIVYSHFYANAGKSSESGGTGYIGTVTGTLVANGASGTFGGISKSTFIAGGGPGSTGTISTVIGSAKVNGPGGLNVYGIYASTFVAGSGSGTIGAVTGYAVAQGSQKEPTKVYANGIAYGYFYAGTGVGGTSTGTIGNITGTGKAESAFGSAYGYGLSGVVAVAGGSGKGTVGNISGTGLAYGHTAAVAQGIAYSHIQAAPLSGGKGYIGTVTGTAVATSQGTAIASGIQKSGVWAGYAIGKIGTVTGTGTATGEGNTTAYGINGVAGIDAQNPSYGSLFPGGYTLKAGSGVTGVGTITAVYGTAVATSNGGFAHAFGIESATIVSGYTDGKIGNVTGKATATAEAGSAYAAGIVGSTIKAGLGYDGYGSIGNITGIGTATSTSGSAAAYGIKSSFISSGLNDGHIGAVTGTATATVLGTNNASAFAYAVGILQTGIYAGYSGIYGNILSVTGTATAKIHSSYENGGTIATATATGLSGDLIYAQANSSGLALDGGTGYIGAIKGTGTAGAYGYQVAATGSGILGTRAVASNGDLGYGTIFGIYGYGTAVADGDDLGATATAFGIGGGSYFGAGTGPDSIGHIGTVYGKGTATATSLGAVPATAFGEGIDDTGFFAGTGLYQSKGYIGNVTGVATVTATGGTATATAIRHQLLADRVRAHPWGYWQRDRDRHGDRDLLLRQRGRVRQRHRHRVYRRGPWQQGRGDHRQRHRHRRRLRDRQRRDRQRHHQGLRHRPEQDIRRVLLYAHRERHCGLRDRQLDYRQRQSDLDRGRHQHHREFDRLRHRRADRLSRDSDRQGRRGLRRDRDSDPRHHRQRHRVLESDQQRRQRDCAGGRDQGPLCLYRRCDRPGLRQGWHRHHRCDHLEFLGHRQRGEQRLRLHLRAGDRNPERRQRGRRGRPPRTSPSAGPGQSGASPRPRISTATAGKPYGVAKAYAGAIKGIDTAGRQRLRRSGLRWQRLHRRWGRGQRHRQGIRHRLFEQVSGGRPYASEGKRGQRRGQLLRHGRDRVHRPVHRNRHRAGDLDQVIRERQIGGVCGRHLRVEGVRRQRRRDQPRGDRAFDRRPWSDGWFRRHGDRDRVLQESVQRRVVGARCRAGAHLCVRGERLKLRDRPGKNLLRQDRRGRPNRRHGGCDRHQQRRRQSHQRRIRLRHQGHLPQCGERGDLRRRGGYREERLRVHRRGKGLRHRDGLFLRKERPERQGDRGRESFTSPCAPATRSSRMAGQRPPTRPVNRGPGEKPSSRGSSPLAPRPRPPRGHRRSPHTQGPRACCTAQRARNTASWKPRTGSRAGQHTAGAGTPGWSMDLMAPRTPRPRPRR